jgi:hypothetical protein
MEYLIIFIVGAFLGGIGTWLSLRNNPKVLSKLDELAKKVEELKR